MDKVDTVANSVKRQSGKLKRLPGFGMWANREDMKDPEK